MVLDPPPPHYWHFLKPSTLSLFKGGGGKGGSTHHVDFWLGFECVSQYLLKVNNRKLKKHPWTYLQFRHHWVGPVICPVKLYLPMSTPIYNQQYTEVVTWWCSLEKLLWMISIISQENPCDGVFFYRVVNIRPSCTQRKTIRRCFYEKFENYFMSYLSDQLFVLFYKNLVRRHL